MTDNMKKKLSLLFMALAIIAFAASAAGGAAITFASQDHDFGTVKARGGKVEFSYTFTNTGTEPLVIISVSNGGCGCTKPEFPKKPIAPGESAKITIHFNPLTFRGEIKRQVTVKTNAGREKLKFHGVILPD